MTTNLFINSVVRCRKSERFRLIAYLTPELSPNNQPSWVAISLDAANPTPVVWRVWKFKQELEAGLIVPAADTEEEVSQSPTAKDLVIGAKRWNRIQGLLRAERDSPFFGRSHELWDKDKRNKLFKEYGESIGLSSKTLLHDFRLYWTGGQTQDALNGSYWRCGRLTADMDGVVEVQVVGEKGHKVKLYAPGTGRSRGRRPKGKLYEPFVMTAPIRKSVIQLATSMFEKDERYSVRAVADQVVRKMFTVRDAHGKVVMSKTEAGEAELMPLGTRPTEDQVRHIIRTAISAATAHKGRVGEADFDNNHAPSTGTVHDDCTGAGDVYEIDATEVDLWLVAKYDRRLIIGHPTLYLVVDRFTNLIVGFYVSLEPAKWEECKQAVLAISGDWEALCKRFGVTYIAAAFPARCVYPNRWVGDRGEFLCFGSDILTHELRQQVSNLPSKKARKKCRVEGGFHTTSVVLKDNAQGYKMPRNARKRQQKKYEKDACLNLDEFVKIYLEIMISHNLKAATPKVVDPNFLATRKKPSPVNHWNHSIENNGAMAMISYEKARRALMPADTATVSQHGIEFRGLVYTFDEAPKLGWFSQASLRGVDKVKVKYSPSLVDTVLIHDKNDATKVYHGYLSKTYSRYFSGYSFAEVEGFMEEYGDLVTGLKKNSQLASRVAAAEAVSLVSEPAHAEMKEVTKGMSLGARMTGGQEARRAEVLDGRRGIHDVTKMPESPIGGAPKDAETAVQVDSSGGSDDSAQDATPSKPKMSRVKSTAPTVAPPAEPTREEASASGAAELVMTADDGLEDLFADLFPA